MFSYTFVPFIFTSATEQILVLSFRLLQLHLQLLARHLLVQDKFSLKEYFL